MRTTAYLKAIMEVYGKTITGLGPYGSQETHDLGAMIVQQGFKSSFIIVYGHSRLARPNKKLCWVYVR